MDLAVATWATGAAGGPAPPTETDRPDDAPAWYRGDEVESQAFLRAQGIVLE